MPPIRLALLRMEKGFVQAMEGHVIALHPMVQEVAVEKIKPSVISCRTLLDRKSVV